MVFSLHFNSHLQRRLARYMKEGARYNEIDSHVKYLIEIFESKRVNEVLKFFGVERKTVFSYTQIHNNSWQKRASTLQFNCSSSYPLLHCIHTSIETDRLSSICKIRFSISVVF
jgi:uncharacterized protein YqhQ